jgi:hypothetical protein
MLYERKGIPVFTKKFAETTIPCSNKRRFAVRFQALRWFVCEQWAHVVS